MASVKFGEVAKGQRKIYVTADNGEEKEYSVPRGVHVNVQEGERMRAGEPLMDGPLNPHDILAVLGEKELQATWSTKSRKSTVSRASPSPTSTSKPSFGRCFAG